MKNIQSIRGMHDVLPTQTHKWQQLESVLRQLAMQYTYAEIRTPVLELTELFKRSIGDVTDIVEKEMYCFLDRNEDSLSLRPEGTASVVRSGIQHGLFYNQVQRLWYLGNMYRHERPQKGRYREFSQFGVEAYGIASADIEAEQLIMLDDLWQRLGLTGLKLQINSLGSSAEREIYKNDLVAYYQQHLNKLDADSKRRLTTNPLRILDSKNPRMHALNKNAPVILDFLGEKSQQHFKQLQSLLDAQQIEYQVNPHLVRGLDYYSATVFEWITDQLGAQGTVCAGGRYDGLLPQLGAKPQAAFGFAIGLNRIIALLDDADKFAPPQAIDVAVLAIEQRYLAAVFKVATVLRRAGLIVHTHCGGGSLRNQLRKVVKMNTKYCLICDQQTIEAQQTAQAVVNLKDIAANTQRQADVSQVIEIVKQTKG